MNATEPRTPKTDITRFVPAAPYRRHIKMIRCWPPFSVMYVQHIYVLPASEAEPLLKQLGMTVEHCWKVKGQSSSDGSATGPGAGMVPELHNVPVLILELDNPTDLADASINLLSSLSTTALYRSHQRKQEVEEQGELSRQYKPANAGYVPSRYDDTGRVVGEDGQGTYERVLAHYQEQALNNLPANRIKKLEQRLAQLESISANEKESLLRQITQLKEQLAEQIALQQQASKTP